MKCEVFVDDGCQEFRVCVTLQVPPSSSSFNSRGFNFLVSTLLQVFYLCCDSRRSRVKVPPPSLDKPLFPDPSTTSTAYRNPADDSEASRTTPANPAFARFSSSSNSGSTLSRTRHQSKCLAMGIYRRTQLSVLVKSTDAARPWLKAWPQVLEAPAEHDDIHLHVSRLLRYDSHELHARTPLPPLQSFHSNRIHRKPIPIPCHCRGRLP
ncbi:hypothetical protein R3P38DRAFT_3297843 [Favolaschia claudopus]|uniref:Uncharacterized protein n=1 Tax=Favolaschia claudopus TaxID=2862362 RepID=A0AAV9Z5Q0_9AGAR